MVNAIEALGKYRYKRAVGVAQYVEWLLLTTEVHGLNPVIGKIYIEQCLLPTVLKRRKIKKKRPGQSHLVKYESV